MLTATFISCQMSKCDRKLAYVHKNCPELLDSAKTSIILDTVIARLEIHDTLAIPIDSNAINSLISKYDSLVLSGKVTKQDTKAFEAKFKYLNAPDFSKHLDTLGIHFTLVRKNGLISYILTKDTQAVKLQGLTTKYTVRPIVKNSVWWRDWWFYAFVLAVIVLLLTLIKR